MESQLKLDTLDTKYVSLAALIRHLRESGFKGRLHVALDGYEADVFFYGDSAPSVMEKDLSSGRESRGEEAQQRLLVRAREPGGLITIYEGTPDTTVESEQVFSKQDRIDEHDWTQIIEASEEIISAVERAVESKGLEFKRLFRTARIELGDDYPFIDPTIGGFEYTDAKVVLTADPSPITFQQALIGCLKRVVDEVARNNGEAPFRERVAVELAMAARRQPQRLGEFESQLDRIAGTRVL